MWLVCTGWTEQICLCRVAPVTKLLRPPCGQNALVVFVLCTAPTLGSGGNASTYGTLLAYEALATMSIKSKSCL